MTNNDKIIKILENFQEKYREEKKLCTDIICQNQFAGAIGACKDIIDNLKKRRKK
jgi:hypothetical protein